MSQYTIRIMLEEDYKRGGGYCMQVKWMGNCEQNSGAIKEEMEKMKMIMQQRLPLAKNDEVSCEGKWDWFVVYVNISTPDAEKLVEELKTLDEDMKLGTRTKEDISVADLSSLWCSNVVSYKKEIELEYYTKEEKKEEKNVKDSKGAKTATTKQKSNKKMCGLCKGPTNLKCITCSNALKICMKCAEEDVKDPEEPEPNCCVAIIRQIGIELFALLCAPVIFVVLVMFMPISMPSVAIGIIVYIIVCMIQGCDLNALNDFDTDAHSKFRKKYCIECMEKMEKMKNVRQYSAVIACLIPSGLMAALICFVVCAVFIATIVVSFAGAFLQFSELPIEN